MSALLEATPRPSDWESPLRLASDPEIDPENGRPYCPWCHHSHRDDELCRLAVVVDLAAYRADRALHAMRAIGRRALALPLAAALVLLALVVGGSLLEPPTASSSPSHVATPVSVALAEHRCWSGPAPEGVRAGRVVVTLPGAPDRPVVWSSQRRVDHAIRRALFDGPGRYVVRGFCR